MNTLRARIMLAVLLILLPLLVLILISAEMDRQAAIKEAEYDALALTESIATANQQQIESTRQLLTALAQLPSVKDRSSAECSRLFERMAQEFDQYTGFFIVDIATNRSVCSSIDLSDAEWYRSFLERRDFTIGRYQIGRVTNQPNLAIAYPVYGDDGTLVAAIAAGLSLDWLNDFIQQQDLPPETVIRLIDDAGVLLAAYPPSPDLVIGELYRNEVVRETALNRQSGTLQALALDDEAASRLFGFTSFGIESGSVHTIVGLSEDNISTEANRNRDNRLIGLALVSLFVIGVAFISSGILIQPIRQLTANIRELETGHSKPRSIATSRIVELEEVVTAFNDMADRIERDKQRQMDDLAAVNSQLRDEINERSEAEARTRILQALSAALSEALTSQQVAHAVIEKGLKPIGSHTAALAVYTPATASLQLLSPYEAAHIPIDMLTATPVMLSEQDPLVKSFYDSRPIYIESRTTPVESRIPGDTHLPMAAVAYVPLIVSRQTIGCLKAGFPQARVMDEPFRDLLTTIADYAAQALDRVRLYEAEIIARRAAERSKDRISQLQMITAELSEAKSREAIADITLKYGTNLVGAVSGLCFMLDSSGNELHRFAMYNPQTPVEMQSRWEKYPLDPNLPMGAAILEKRSFWFASSAEAVLQFPAMQSVVNVRPGGFIVLPLLQNGRAIGGVSFNFIQADVFDDEMRAVIGALMHQCAGAFERLRLQEEAQQAAVVHERHRLARDLHDAVSQTLFSASAMAEGLPHIWQRDNQTGQSLLQQVVILNRSALAEMRTLLLELRPEAIARTAMPTLLRQLIDAAQGRRDVVGKLTLRDETITLPPDVHEAFFRVAQESINNVIKHSQAAQFEIMLEQREGQVILTIRDNGRGFDSGLQGAGFGLISIRERAQAVNAQVEITSIPNEGTNVTLIWSESTETASASGT